LFAFKNIASEYEVTAIKDSLAHDIMNPKFTKEDLASIEASHMWHAGISDL
jgi:hypothetical protein